MKLLTGEYSIKLNAKKRLTIPAKLRSKLGNHIVVAQGFEECLIIVSADQWEDLTATASQGPYVDLSVRDATRFLMANALEAELDEQGRFVLPDNLCQHLGVTGENDLAIIGAGRYAEIWQKNKWQEHKKYLTEHAGNIAQRINKREI